MSPEGPPRGGGGEPLADADYQALAAFRHGLRVFLRFSEEAARAAGMTPAQHQLLLAVRGWPGGSPPSVADVSVMLQLRPHSVTELVDRAASAGLLETQVDPTDRRRHRLVLTDVGAQRLAELSVAHRRELGRLQGTLRSLLDILPEVAPADE